MNNISIHGYECLTHTEKQLADILLKNAKLSIRKEPIYQIPLKSLYEISGYTQNGTELLKNNIKALLGVHIKMQGKHEGKVEELKYIGIMCSSSHLI